MMDLLKNSEHCVMTKSQDCYIGMVVDGGCHLFPSNFTCVANFAALNGMQYKADAELIASLCSLPIPVCVGLKMVRNESLFLTGSETGRVAHLRVVLPRTVRAQRRQHRSQQCRESKSESTPRS